MKQPWLTLARCIYYMVIGASSALIVYYSHDFTLPNFILLAVVIVVAGLAFTLGEIGIEKAMSGK